MKGRFTEYHFTFSVNNVQKNNAWITLKEILSSIYLAQIYIITSYFLKALPATAIIYYSMIYEHDLILSTRLNAYISARGDRAERCEVTNCSAFCFDWSESEHSFDWMNTSH